MPKDALAKRFAGWVETCSATTITGWAANGGDPTDVAIRVNGLNIASVRPTLARPDVAAIGLHGVSGFRYDFAAPLKEDDIVSVVFPDGVELKWACAKRGQKFPDKSLLMQITNSEDLDAFKKSFALYRSTICSMLARAGSNIADMEKILDFGCGAGRLFYSLHDVMGKGQKIFACDVNERAITWCRDNLGYADVVLNGVREPLSYSDNMFDLVVAVSVFTHLELDLQRHWAREMHRVIKPGRYLMMTAHGPSWFPKLIDIRLTNPKATQMRVDHLGDDALFIDLRFSGAIDDDPQGQREVATAHTRAAVGHLFAGFEVVCHDPRSKLANHDLYLLRKRVD